jgi:hypothetical protein
MKRNPTLAGQTMRLLHPFKVDGMLAQGIPKAFCDKHLARDA